MSDDITPDLSLDDLRFEAKRLHHAYIAREPWAVERVKQTPPRKDLETLVRADFLHIVARDSGFASWPALKSAAEDMGLPRASRLQRLKTALYHGQNDVVAALLDETPDLADGSFGLECALYRREAVAAALARNPALAVTQLGPRRPILHLAFSKWIHAQPVLEAEMLGIAELLLAHGADVNDGVPWGDHSDHKLSALYGAIGHANNMALGRWLLAKGANPNDGESLYHATELGHHDGLRMLLEAGAEPNGTNALFRAMDFHDHEAVAMLLAAGADPDGFNGAEVGGEAPHVIPALFQAARRGCDRRMAEMLLEAGADPGRAWKGAGAYAFARVFGNSDVAEALKARGMAGALSREETLMAQAADGEVPEGSYLDPAKLPAAYAGLLREILHLPGRLAQMRGLVALGLPYDVPDGEGVTPVQAAGWCGLPEVLDFFIRLRPDMGHVNRYGGTLLTTIIHGSENNPEREGRDYLACLERVLTEGVALPKRAIAGAGRADVRGYLQDWAAAHPGQVV